MFGEGGESIMPKEDGFKPFDKPDPALQKELDKKWKKQERARERRAALKKKDK
jgi:hypothetical protein